MRRARLLVLAALAATAVVAISPAPVGAQPQQQADGDKAEPSAARVVARLPRSAELIVVFEDAAGLRRSGLWEALRPAMGDMTALAATWGQLASTLGWTPEEAFDRLLGSRVALVVRGLPDHGGLLGHPVQMEAAGGKAGGGVGGEGVRWALVSEVSAETERRLLERLAASPRDLVRGCPLLAVERGTYELAIYRPKKGAERGAGTTLILGESGKAELMDELIGVLTDGAAAPMRGTPAHAALTGLGRADAAVLYRWPGAEGEAWSDYAAVAVRRAGDGQEAWSARLSVRDAALAEDLLRIEPSTGAALRALRAGSLAAIVETRVPGEAGGGPEANPAGVVLHMLGIPAAVQDRLGQRQVLVAATGSDADGGLGIAVGLEVVDVPRAATEGDRFMAGLAASLEGDTDGGAAAQHDAAAVPDFCGIAPAAVRAVPLRRTPAALQRLLDGGGGEGGGADLAWVYADEGEGRGWWVMGAAGSSGTGGDAPAAGLVRRVAAAVTSEAEGQGEPARWLSQGVLRLAALEAAIEAETPGLALVRGVLRRLDELSWGVWVNDGGELEGTVRVRMTGGGR